MKKFVPKWWWLRNKYTLTLFVFAVWMTFIDNNDVFRHYGLIKRLNQVKSEYKVKQDMISDTKRQLKELQNKRTLEKFAREEYFFKKPGEEVFVIISDKPAEEQ